MSKGGSSGGVSTATGKIIRSFQQAAPDSGSVPKDVMARAMQGMMATTDVGGFSVKERHIHVLVGGIRYAYISGSSGKEPSQQAIEKILNKRFSISSSKPQGKGAGAPEDYHTVAQINVRHAISDAYAAGQKHEAAGPAPAPAKAAPAAAKTPKKTAPAALVSFVGKAMGFDTLKHQKSSADFKEAHVETIRSGLTSAFVAGSGGKPPAWGVLDHIAKKQMGIITLKTRNSDSMDFHEVSSWGVKASIKAAYAAGIKAAAKAGPAPAPAKKPGGIVGNLAAGPTYNAQGQLVAFTSAGAAPGTAPNKLTVTKDAQGKVTKIETSVHKSPKALAAVKAEKAANAAAAKAAGGAARKAAKSKAAKSPKAPTVAQAKAAGYKPGDVQYGWSGTGWVPIRKFTGKGWTKV